MNNLPLSHWQHRGQKLWQLIQTVQCPDMQGLPAEQLKGRQEIARQWRQITFSLFYDINVPA